MITLTLAVDPGVSGGFALTDDEGKIVICEPYRDPDDALTYLTLIHAMQDDGVKLQVLIERVSASPIMSPSAAFAFGENYGWWLGAIAASLGIHPTPIAPQVWQAPYKDRKQAVLELPVQQQYHAWKQTLKQIAQETWPEQRVTLATADALLLSLHSTRRAV